MAKCLYCYKELNGNERDFHKACMGMKTKRTTV